MLEAEENDMSWFSTMLSGGVDKIVDSVGNAVDKIVTSESYGIIRQIISKANNEEIIVKL